MAARDAVSPACDVGLARRFAGPFRWLWSLLGVRRLEREAAWMMDRAVALADGADMEPAVAAAGRLLARAAREASDAREADRLWDLAVGLLDRLCEIGGARGDVPVAWAARLEQVFAAAPRVNSPRC